MKKSTITNQWLYSFLLLIMAMAVPATLVFQS